MHGRSAHFLRFIPATSPRHGGSRRRPRRPPSRRGGSWSWRGSASSPNGLCSSTRSLDLGESELQAPRKKMVENGDLVQILSEIYDRTFD